MKNEDFYFKLLARIELLLQLDPDYVDINDLSDYSRGRQDAIREIIRIIKENNPSEIIENEGLTTIELGNLQVGTFNGTYTDVLYEATSSLKKRDLEKCPPLHISDFDEEDIKKMEKWCKEELKNEK